MKRLFWAIAILIGLASGILFYLWQQATATPSWYRNPAGIRLNDPAAVQQAKDLVTAKMAKAKPQANGTHELYLTDKDVNAIAITGIGTLAKHTPLTAAIESVNSTIQDGRIESGAVINLADVSLSSLNPTERNLVSQLKAQFPGLVNREIYVGIEGRPIVQNGQLQFDDSLRIKIGNLSLTAADAAQRLGLSEATLQKVLHQELGTLQIEDVQVIDDQVRLRGTM